MRQTQRKRDEIREACARSAAGPPYLKGLHVYQVDLILGSAWHSKIALSNIPGGLAFVVAALSQVCQAASLGVLERHDLVEQLPCDAVCLIDASGTVAHGHRNSPYFQELLDTVLSDIARAAHTNALPFELLALPLKTCAQEVDSTVASCLWADLGMSALSYKAKIEHVAYQGATPSWALASQNT